MKKLSSLLAVVFFFSVFLMNCIKDNRIKNVGPLPEDENETECQVRSVEGAYGDLLDFEKVTIKCSGECDCGLEGDLTSIQCSCDPCVMRLVFYGENQEVERTTDLTDVMLEVPLLSYFLANERWGDQLIKEMVIYNHEEDVAVLFTYDNAGVENTVMYANVAGGKTYEIDCYGGCDCREVYSFSTNSASCSCDDCKMSVTEVGIGIQKP